MKIISYVITHDYGFAPNPYGGYLTLATCKPKIRAYAEIGDIIIATGSTTGAYKNRLIYASKISEIINMEEYFVDPRFEIKKPNKNNPMGDNIYYKEHGNWKMLKNDYHNIEHLDYDTQSENVIVCEQFWYFGDDAPSIPEKLSDIVKYGVGHKYSYDSDHRKLVSNFLFWLEQFDQGVIGNPCHKIRRSGCNMSSKSSSKCGSC